MEQVFRRSSASRFSLAKSIKVNPAFSLPSDQTGADMAWSPSKADRPDCQNLVRRKGGPSPLLD